MRIPGLLALVVAALLSACASYGPQWLKPGATIAETTAQMGPPTVRRSLPGGGERLEFARGPFGEHTYMLDFAADGRLAKWEQVLDEAHFAAVQVGMDRQQLLELLGRPSRVAGVATENRQLWAYRYRTPFCQWFEVVIDRQQKVIETGYGADPRCDRTVF